MRALVFAGIAVFLASGGCATVTTGTLQSVSVNTPGVTGAVCTLSSRSIGKRTITAPATVAIEKGVNNVDVHCTKECYQDGEGVITSSLEVMTAGNILIGGVVGVGVDAISGAINKYEPEVEITMKPIPGCRPKRG